MRRQLNVPSAGLVAAAVVALGVITVMRHVVVREPMSCDRARDVSEGYGVVVCGGEYARTGDPRVAAKLANALRRSERLDDARALATTLLDTAARADALQILAKIALKQRKPDPATATGEAMRMLQAARVLHVGRRELKGAAIDEQALAGIFQSQQRFAEALLALDACITESRAARDPVTEGYCHLSAGVVLGHVGMFDAARAELGTAAPLFTHDRDLAALEIERGALDQRVAYGPQHNSHNAEAVIELEHAVVHAMFAGATVLARQAELNLVYSLAEVGRTADAATHLEIARVLDPENQDALDRELLEARIAFHRGEFAHASRIDQRIYDLLEDDEYRLRVAVIEARIGLATGDLDATVRWATRGVELVEGMRGAQSALELRPWMMAMRRQPHELLFTALARAHRNADALIAFDRWQGRTLLDALARERSSHATDLRVAALHTEQLRTLVPVLSTAPLIKPAAWDTLAGAMQQVDLVALLSAEDVLWRITARHGAIEIVELGPIAALRAPLERFVATPTDAALASTLGAQLLGEAAFRDTSETLFVVLDAPIASLPIAALRVHDRLLVSLRPMVRASRLSELACVAPPAARHAVVLADARYDLQAARVEAIEAAAAFGTAPQIGANATSDALFAAQPDDVLHAAIHARPELGGGALALFDRSVSGLEVARRSRGPALVVLSACGSGTADDGELATSLATGFLASGSRQVIATLRPVGDRGAAELTQAFYRAGGARDPVRVLARVQAELARSSNTDWPYFVLFGHDICRKELQ